MRWTERRRSAGRRPRAFLGRRFAFAPAAVAACVCACPPPATAQDVVSATLYSSTQGNVSHPTVGTDALASCPSYSGTSPIYLYPGGQPSQPTQNSWALATVVTCGLGVLPSDRQRGRGSQPQSRLRGSARQPRPDGRDPLPGCTACDLRRRNGGSDHIRASPAGRKRQQRRRSGDRVRSPIAIAVYAAGQPLIVRAPSKTVSSTTTDEHSRVQHGGADSCRCHGAGGQPQLELELRRQHHSTQPSPRHQFAAGTLLRDRPGGRGPRRQRGHGELTFTATPAPPPEEDPDRGQEADEVEVVGGHRERQAQQPPRGSERHRHRHGTGTGTGTGTSTGASQPTPTTPSTTLATTSPTGTTPATAPPPVTTPTTTTPPPPQTAPHRRKRATPTAPAGTAGDRTPGQRRRHRCRQAPARSSAPPRPRRPHRRFARRPAHEAWPRPALGSSSLFCSDWAPGGSCAAAGAGEPCFPATEGLPVAPSPTCS